MYLAPEWDVCARRFLGGGDWGGDVNYNITLGFTVRLIFRDLGFPNCMDIYGAFDGL